VTMSPLEERSSNALASFQCAMSSALRIGIPLLSPPGRGDGGEGPPPSPPSPPGRRSAAQSSECRPNESNVLKEEHRPPEGLFSPDSQIKESLLACPFASRSWRPTGPLVRSVRRSRWMKLNEDAPRICYDRHSCSYDEPRSRSEASPTMRRPEAAVLAFVLFISFGCQAAPTPTATPLPIPPPTEGAAQAGLPSPTEPPLPTHTPIPVSTPTPEPALRPVRILDHGEDRSGRNWIVCLDWSPDGDYLAAGGTDGSVIIWEVETGEQLQVLQQSTWPESCDWSPSGDRIAVGGIDSLIRIWEVSSGERKRTLNGHLGIIQRLAWSPDGSMIAALGSLEKSARTWDTESGEPLHALPSSEGTNDLDWSPDGTAVATSTGKGVKVWDAASGQLLYVLDSAGATRSVRWSPDGLALLASGADGPAAWKIIGLQPIETQLPAGRLSSPALWSPDGSMIAAGYSDGSFWVKDIQSDDRVLSSTAPWGSIVHMAWSPDSRFLAGFVRYLGGEDFLDWILLWDLNAMGEPAILKGHDDAVFHLAWSPNENILATGAHDGRVILWGSSP